MLPERIRGSEAVAFRADCDDFRFDVVRWWENFRESAYPLFSAFWFPCRQIGFV